MKNSIFLFVFINLSLVFSQEKCEVLRKVAHQNQRGASSNNDCCIEDANLSDSLLVNQDNKNEIIKKNAPFGLPKTKNSNIVTLINPTYLIGYDTLYKIPMWVQYRLLKKEEKTQSKRVDCFRYDPRLSINIQSSYNDYALEGLDTFQRGHLKPSADGYLDLYDNINTFMMTNMAPQHQTLNQCEWEILEDFMNKHAEKKSVEVSYLISGCVILKKEPHLLNNKTVIPDAFYKIYFFRENNHWHYWTYYLIHDYVLSDYESYKKELLEKRKTIREIEKLSGFNFYVCNKNINKIENQLDTSFHLNELPKYKSFFCNKFSQN